ncbi:GNAT family N-acetyltransferase [Advenella sp. FME57]|uniref:GNAT family N-acetyltransferase n=1 Tax=Advenella sp. FME57 TaxID=2742604 RepID=UPI001868E560|nr:GNAT family N-acetyltransferase [Advenella sp. FME57]
MMMSTENCSQVRAPSIGMRALHVDDLPQMLALQASVYPPALLESAQVLASKIGAVPAGWTSLAATDGNTLCAYALGYPWRSELQPCWNRPLALQHDCDVLYLHDVAVSPAYAGRGLANELVSQLMRQGQQLGLSRAILIAVEGAQGYWSRLGFVAIPTGSTDPAFGGDAVLMQRELAPPGSMLLDTA